MNIKNAMGFLGLCRKANKLLCGHDVVKESVVKSSAQLVMLSSDASERLEREMRYACSCDGKNIPVIRTSCSMDDFAAGIGKRSAVYAVLDAGFAAGIQEKFMEESDDN